MLLLDSLILCLDLMLETKFRTYKEYFSLSGSVTTWNCLNKQTLYRIGLKTYCESGNTRKTLQARRPRNQC